MHRRRFLGSIAGGLAAFGGCLAGGGRGPRTSPPPDTRDTGTPTKPGTDDRPGATDATVWEDGMPDQDEPVRDVTVSPAVVGLNSPDSIGTYGERDEQFVVATVAAGSSGPERDAFSIETADGSYDPIEEIGYAGRRLWEHGEAFEAPGEGWIAFRVPKPSDAGDAAISWPGGEYPLPGDALERLSRPPTEFEIRALDGPESVELGDEAVVTLTVENVGGSDGTFVGALNRTGPWVAYAPAAAFQFEVPAGETASRRHAHTPADRTTDEEAVPPMTFRLNWHGESVSREIDVTLP